MIIVFSVKFLIQKHGPYSTKNEIKYILNSNWESENFYVLPKVHKTMKIIEEINENNNICVNNFQYMILQLVGTMISPKFAPPYACLPSYAGHH